MVRRILLLPGLIATALTARQSTYPTIRRTLSQEKRNILVARLQHSQKDRDKAGEQGKTTVELYERIKSIDRITNDLFSGWQKEMDQMGNVRLKPQGAAMLRESGEQQAANLGVTGKTEAHLTVVLASFQDQGILPGHTLDARALGWFKDTSTQINTGVTALLKSIDNSMQEGDKLYDSRSASGSEAK